MGWSDDRNIPSCTFILQGMYNIKAILSYFPLYLLTNAFIFFVYVFYTAITFTFYLHRNNHYLSAALGHVLSSYLQVFRANVVTRIKQLTPWYVTRIIIISLSNLLCIIYLYMY